MPAAQTRGRALTDIGRKSFHITSLTIGTTEAASTAVNFENFAGGVFELISGSTATITVYATSAADPGTATFRPLKEMVDGTLTTVTFSVATTDCMRLPAACYDATALKFVGDVAGVANIAIKG